MRASEESIRTSDNDAKLMCCLLYLKQYAYTFPSSNQERERKQRGNQ